ncbi:MAG: FG-GAP-like repeat-containing protein [Acidobacteriota bacterium]|nr:FG-GAP-like repeat-containing protein [Acidobacteriota bacterium]
MHRPLLASGLALVVCATSLAQGPFPGFAEHTITADFPGAYCVRAVDVDGDGRNDVIAQGRELAWFQNPTWTRHPLTGETKGNIFLAARDLDGDGRVEIAVASDFGLADSRAGGTLTLLRRGQDLYKPWKTHRIGADPTAHRLYWGDLDGDGTPELVVSPILGPGAEEPLFDQAGAKLAFYDVPAELDSLWPRHAIDNSLPVTHGIEVVDFDGDGRHEVLTASYEGVHLLDARSTTEGLIWTRTALADGHQSDPAPRRGSSEVALGHLAGGRRFFATTEPWHGNQVVVYRSTASGTDWERSVLDDSLVFSHALAVADLDADGSDEIVAGFRGEGTSLYAYDATDAEGARWERHTIDDGGIAAQRCEAADMDGDGDLDLVASGGSTANVKWYENQLR